MNAITGALRFQPLVHLLNPPGSKLVQLVLADETRRKKGRLESPHQAGNRPEG